MGQLKTKLVPTWANLGQLGQLGANMDVAKPEKSVFRLDGSTIFTKLYVSSWKHLGNPSGMPWEVLGTPWVDVWGGLGDALGGCGDTENPWEAFGDPWESSAESLGTP